MFDHNLFFSQFWNWWIIILTLGGIVGLFWLIIWMSSSRPKPDQKIETMGHVWDESLEEYNNPLPMWWLMMFYFTLIFGILYLVLYPGLGSFAGILEWSSAKQYQQEVEAAQSKYGPIYAKYQNEPLDKLAKNPDAVEMGRHLFLTYCTACHGSDAGGGPGFPNLRDNDWLYGGEPETIQTTITSGRQGMMPTAEQNNLHGENDINNAAQYVLSLSGKPHDQAAATEGQKHFMRICMACHGTEGKGTPALGAPNLTDDTWLYGGSEDKIKETITKGRQGRMPAHGELLGEAKAHLLATYVYSLSQENTK